MTVAINDAAMPARNNKTVRVRMRRSRLSRHFGIFARVSGSANSSFPKPRIAPAHGALGAPVFV